MKGVRVVGQDYHLWSCTELFSECFHNLTAVKLLLLPVQPVFTLARLRFTLLRNKTREENRKERMRKVFISYRDEKNPSRLNSECFKRRSSPLERRKQLEVNMSKCDVMSCNLMSCNVMSTRKSSYEIEGDEK